MSKQGYLPDENLPESVLIRRIASIIEHCDQDLEDETIKTRDAYNQVKAFHFDAIKHEVEKWDSAYGK